MSKSLIIDPGHGGSDPGATGFGVKEKDWNLKMSLYQYGRLKELGAEVAITRKSDKTLESGPRTNLIKGKYDYCMSNHFNAFNGKARGVETIHSIHAKPTIAEKLADVVVKTSGLPLRRVFTRKLNNGRDYYFMHRLTGTTQTIIVEYGFLDNKQDHDYYKKDSNFYKVAEAVVKEWCDVLGVEYREKGEKEKPTEDKPKQSAYQGNSIVDYLVSIGENPSFLNREKLAKEHGINNYRGTAKQNLELLAKLRGGSAPKKQPKTIKQMADEIIAGKHGNGHARRRKSLGISKSEYEKVRREVNRRF